MTTALIIIDVQESFRHRGWEHISAPDIVERCNRLVEHARSHDDVVAWVLHTDPGSGGVFDPEQGLIRLQDGLTPADDDIHVTKTSHNAFTTTNLQQQLLRRGVDRIRVAGIRTEQCVETTARVASDFGYPVEVVIDATATHPIPLPDGGYLMPDDIVARTAAVLRDRFATITTIDAVVAS